MRESARSLGSRRTAHPMRRPLGTRGGVLIRNPRTIARCETIDHDDGCRAGINPTASAIRRDRMPRTVAAPSPRTGADCAANILPTGAAPTNITAMIDLARHVLDLMDDA